MERERERERDRRERGREKESGKVINEFKLLISKNRLCHNSQNSSYRLMNVLSRPAPGFPDDPDAAPASPEGDAVQHLRQHVGHDGEVRQQPRGSGGDHVKLLFSAALTHFSASLAHFFASLVHYLRHWCIFLRHWGIFVHH
jgi:hypothetical protein